MLEKLREMYKSSASKWIKWVTIGAGVIYAILYITSCNATYKCTMKCENRSDSTYVMTYTSQGRVKK